jgi:hypothetical protein
MQAYQITFPIKGKFSRKVRISFSTAVSLYVPKLPRIFHSVLVFTVNGNIDSKSCIAEVQLVETDNVKCSWYDLWAGAVAVNKLCVEVGESGISYGHGKSVMSHVSISVN